LLVVLTVFPCLSWPARAKKRASIRPTLFFAYLEILFRDSARCSWHTLVSVEAGFFGSIRTLHSYVHLKNRLAKIVRNWSSRVPEARVVFMRAVMLK
jgi:hypothetical protein